MVAMALCLIPSHAVCRHHSSMSIKYWLNSLCPHCGLGIQVVHGVFTHNVYVRRDEGRGNDGGVVVGGGCHCSQMMAVKI